MKKFGFATIAATGFAAAIVGIAGPAQAVANAEAPAIAFAPLSVPASVDHLDWLRDIQPKVNVPHGDTSVRHSGTGR
ncbi:MAG: hypothetical protein QOD39_4510 [Mycobacterium sp.]|jgi:hypothetical protein|nr:hypothetical protein [Mycobacterium sp.]